MRKAMKKWNYETHQYEEYKVPSDWNVSMYEKKHGENGKLR